MNGVNYIDRTLYPLTHPQKRIWYIEKIYPCSSLYNIGGSVRIKGSIDFSKLEESINLLIKKNVGLRLRIFEENGEVMQFVSNYERVKVDFIDFSIYESPEEEFNKWVEKEARKPFVIENERLFYFALFRISDNDNGYLAKFHHIISDGWSINIMTEHICDTYMKLLNGDEIHDNTERSYIEYISNEKKYILSDRFLTNKSFWNEKFGALPDTYLNKSSDVIEGKRKTFKLELELSSKIKKFTADNKCSLNTFFITSYLIYLYKTTMQEDTVIGTPVLNRSGKKEKSMFGMFTSTMPFRFTVDDNLNVMDTMIKVNEQLMECYFNQKYPYDLLIQDLELKKKGYDNLFNTCVNYYNTKLNSELNGFPIENVEFYNGNQIYSLQLVIKDWSDSGNLTLDFDYKVNDYSDAQIDDMYIRLLSLANHIVTNPSEKVKGLSLLSNDERKKLLNDFNATETQYPKDKTIYQLFEEQAEKTPDKVAILFANNQLKYRELNEKANQLARYLVGKSVGKDTIVGLLTTHSIETVVGILGILKAGGAYLPIDPSYPCDRINYMLKDSGMKILLTNYKLPDSIIFNGLTVNLKSSNLYVGNKSNLELANNSTDLVYVIYTSGSTGTPKGTMIEHKGLVNYIWWAKKMYVGQDDEAFPLYSSLAFDLTITSIFTPLISGNRIIVYCDDEDEYVLYRILKENQVTVMKLTPSHLTILKEVSMRNSKIKRLIVGGEDLKVCLARSIHENFGGNIDIYNEYGPTETVIGCMIHKYDYINDTGVSVPIGVPADNVLIYILDRDLNPMPLDTIGEIYISGDGVARGYLNRQDLTHDRFIENPFMQRERMYKTGDYARFTSNWNVEYIGRIDSQVKIRGYRIETKEIEKYLLNLDFVKDAIVIDKENEKGEKFLCAYLTLSCMINTDVSETGLRKFLANYIPEYMIPSSFVIIDKIPLTPNGKIRRELLPDPIINTELEKTRGIRAENEQELVNVMSDVLKVNNVKDEDNFFHLGGDSIKAIQITARLYQKGIKLKVKDILSHPFIKEMFSYLEKTDEYSIPGQSECTGNIRFTPITKWFFSQNLRNMNYYNQSLLLSITDDMELDILEKILDIIIKHHDSFRINYSVENDTLFYNNGLLTYKSKIPSFDLSGYDEAEQDKAMMKLGEDLKSELDIQNGVLLKTGIFHLGKRGRRLLLTIHHLAIDGVSWRIILEDMTFLYSQIKVNKGVELPRKTHSVQTWADELENLKTTKVEKEKAFWEDIIRQPCGLKPDFDKGIDVYESSNTLEIVFNEYDTANLLTVSNCVYGTKTNELLIIGLILALRDILNISSIVLEIEGHGREDIAYRVDVSRTVGWFTSIYPVRLSTEGKDLTTQIKHLKEQLRKVPDGGIGFGVLKFLANELTDYRYKNLRFNYLGDYSDSFKLSSFKYAYESTGSDIGRMNEMNFLLDINALIIDDKLKISLTYSKNKFKEETVMNILNGYLDKLNSLQMHCQGKNDIEFTPSDFYAKSITQDELDSIFNH